MNIEHKIRKNAEAGGTGGNARSGDQNNDRSRNSNPGNGMNRNGSGGRSDRRDDRNRQFNRSDRMGGGGPRASNGTTGTYTNSRR